MHLPEVVQRNALLSLSISLFNPLKAEFRWTSQIYHSPERTILGHFFTNLAVNGILGLFHVALTVHNLTKHVTVGKGRSLREMKLLRLLWDCFVPEEWTRVKSIELEGESPPFWILIVIFEYVTSCHLLPFLNRFLNDREVEEWQEGALASSEVAFNGDYTWHNLLLNR